MSTNLKNFTESSDMLALYAKFQDCRRERDELRRRLDFIQSDFSPPSNSVHPLFVFKYADLILPVSKSNLMETIENTSAAHELVKLLYHGFDYKK